MARIAIDFDVNDAQAVAAVNRVKGSIGSVQPPHPAAAQGFTSLHDRILETTGALQKMARVMVSVQVIMATAVALLGIKQIIEAADAWTLMAGRLRVVTENASEVARVQHELVRLAVDTRTSLEATAQLYTRLALNTQDLNLSEATLLVLTKAVSQATLISGATTEEASGAIIQFTQAVALGHFRMQELNSVMMGMPRLSKAMIDGLMLTNAEFRKQVESGKSAISVLRSWTEQSKLTTEIFLPALITQIGKLNEEAALVPTTSGQAFQQLKNQLSEIVGQTDISPLVKSLQDLAYTLTDPNVQTAIQSFTNAMVQMTAVAVSGVAPALDAINLAVRGLIINQLLWIALIDDFAHGASWSQLKARYQEIMDNATSAQGSASRLWETLTNPEGDPTRALKELDKATKDAARSELALLDAEKLRNRPGAPDDAARMAAAKRLEEAMKVAKLVNDIHLDQAQFEKDQAVKTTDFLIHENKRQYENYAQDEVQFIERELTLLEVRKDQELAFLEESRANVKADLALKLRAITAHAADKKNLEDPGLTKIKRNEAELQAFKQLQDLDQKALDLTRQTEENKIKIVDAAQDRITKIVKEASGARLQREIADLDKALEQVERGSAAEIALQAKKYQTLSSQYHAGVQAFIDSELFKTGILENETVKRLAKEAGLLKAKQAINREILDNAVDLAEQQARLANNIDAAYSIGFAEAATKADDALTAMRKSGAEAFQSLKSGLSDFLFDMFTGAKSIGDVFVNLGKRILRSMTDAFAEILAKQLAMSAGFSFTGILGVAGTAAAGFEGAPNAAAQAITGLGNAATGSADALSGMTGILGLVMRVLTMFGNGLMGILGFFGQIVQGIASGGGIVNTLTSAFGGLVKSGGALYSIFNGLSNVGSSLFSVFTEGTSLANVFQAAFDSLGLTSGGFGGVAAANGGTIGTVNAAGSFASFLGQWVPIAGALYMAAMAIQNFLKGDAAVKIGTAIGTLILPGFGSWLGGIIGGLFSPTPKAAVSASILPFDRGNIHDALRVSVSGNVMSGAKETALAEQIMKLLEGVLTYVIAGTVQMQRVLLPKFAAELEAAILELESSGLEFLDYTKFKGSKAGQSLVAFAQELPDLMIQALSESLGFGDTDLKALGGGKTGDAASGFQDMLFALNAMTAIVKEVGPAVDLSSVSLAQFTKGAIDLFKGFATEGEAFTDTIKRVMQTFGEIIALKDQIHTSLAAVSDDLTEVVSIIKTQMANAEANMVSMVDALTVAIESGAKPEEVLAAAKAAAQAVADTLKMEIDAVTAMHDAVVKMNTAITDGVELIVSLTKEIDALRGAAADPADMQASIDGIVALFNQLTDVTSRISLFASSLALLSESTGDILLEYRSNIPRFNHIMSQIREMTNPTEAIAALKDLAGAVESGLQAGITGINRQTQSRIAGLNAERAVIERANTEQKAALDAQKTAIHHNTDLQRQALEAQKAGLQSAFDAQKTALQTALSLSQQWASVLQSVKTQLVDLFNLLAPTHPLTSLNEIRAQFDAAFSDFQANPTAEGATGVQDLAKQLLQLAQQTPGYDLPSAAFQGLAGDVQTALEAIRAFAESQPTQEAIQAQIAALELEQVGRLAGIDAQIAALNASETAQLAAIDVQIQALDASQAAALASIDAQIAQANADGQASIQYLQELAALGLEAIREQLTIEVAALAAQQAQAAAALQAVLGDKTYEQFILDKQVEAAGLLRGILETLERYLGQLVQQFVPGAVFTPPPSHAGGLDYVPYDNYRANLHRGERVLTAGENSSYGGSKGGGTKTVTITLSPTIQIQGGSSSQMKSDLDKALVELVDGPSLTHRALLELAKRAS